MPSARRTGTNENISTYGGGGRDYTALAVWEAATDVDLVTAAQSEVLECYDDAVFDDNVTLQSATTSADYFRIIRPASGQKHNGTPNSGVRFNSTTDVQLIFINENYSQVQDIVGTLTINSGNSRIIFLLSGERASAIGCIAVDGANSGAGIVRGFQANVGTAVIVDCISINNDGDGFFFAGDAADDSNTYNCTSVNSGGYGFNINGNATHTLKNCLASGNTTADFNGTAGGSSTNNASSDATAPGTSSRTSQTFTFADTGSDDYHLAASDAGAKGFGTDLSADSAYAFDDDIDQETISTWSIGADAQAVTAGTGGGFMFRRRRRM